jgi:hypothetical protein
MRLLLLLPMLALQGDAPVEVAPAPAPTAHEVLTHLATRAAAGELEAALTDVDELLERDVPGTWSELDRAELRFAEGVLAARYSIGQLTDEAFEQAARRAQDAFSSASALAGAGELRRDATYDAALIDLWDGERQRARLPEVGGAPTGPPPPPAGAGDEPPPDPLELARAAYLRSRDGFVERLLLDWRDADTRANLELIQRRLRELDEIEQQREEQQSEQQQDPSQDPSGEEGEPDDSEQQQDDEQEGQEGSEEEQDQQQQPADEEQQPEEEPSDEQQQPEEQPAEEPQPPEEGEGAEPEEAPAEEEPSEQAEPTERLLTREEVMRLLDRLAELEAEGERVRAAAAKSGHPPVERDW